MDVAPQTIKVYTSRINVPFYIFACEDYWQVKYVLSFEYRKKGDLFSSFENGIITRGSYESVLLTWERKGCRVRDHMVVGFTTTYAISA